MFKLQDGCYICTKICWLASWTASFPSSGLVADSLLRNARSRGCDAADAPVWSQRHHCCHSQQWREPISSLPSASCHCQWLYRLCRLVSPLLLTQLIRGTSCAKNTVLQAFQNIRLLGYMCVFYWPFPCNNLIRPFFHKTVFNQFCSVLYRTYSLYWYARADLWALSCNMIIWQVPIHVSYFFLLGVGNEGERGWGWDEWMYISYNFKL